MSSGTRISGKCVWKLCQGSHPWSGNLFISRISLPRMFFWLAPSPFCEQLLLWLFSVVLDVPFLSSPAIPSLPLPSSVPQIPALACGSALIPDPSLPCNSNRDLPVSCQAPPLGVRGPPFKHLQSISKLLSPLCKALQHGGAWKTKQNMTAAGIVVVPIALMSTERFLPLSPSVSSHPQRLLCSTTLPGSAEGNPRAAQPLALIKKISPEGGEHLDQSCSKGLELSCSERKEKWDFIPTFSSTGEPWCLPGVVG